MRKTQVIVVIDDNRVRSFMKLNLLVFIILCLSLFGCMEKNSIDVEVYEQEKNEEEKIELSDLIPVRFFQSLVNPVIADEYKLSKRKKSKFFYE